MDRRIAGDGATGRSPGLRRRNERFLDVHGAAEHNLRDVDVSFEPGLTAVVGVSGSGKSSLAFDVVYAEARRRLVESLALGGNRARVPAAQVRRIEGLGPAVAVAQNVLNRNPASTLATSVGLHPFLRILYSRFAEVECPHCHVSVRALSAEERLTTALDLLARKDRLDVDVAIVRGLVGSHARLLAGIRGQFAQVTVDGRPWAATSSSRVPRLDPALPHDVVVRVATLRPGLPAAEVRATLERADALGRPEVLLGGTPVLRAPICPQCGAWVRPLAPSAFRGDTDTSSHRIAGITLQELIGRSVTEVLEFVQRLPLGSRARRIQDELLRRLRPLQELGLGHLALDRSMPTLSRGEAQRTRLAVVLSGRLEDLLHVLDEPTIGLHHSDLRRLLDAIVALPGPVLMVEHDPLVVAMADDVVEIGPGGGGAGGRLVFQGPPADLWRAGTASGVSFSAGTRRPRSRRPPSDDRIRVTGASLRNLRNVDCEIPLGLLDGDHRAVRSGQDHAGPRGVVGVLARAWACRVYDVRRAGDTGSCGGSGAAGQQSTVESGDVHQGARPDPRRLRERDRTLRIGLHLQPGRGCLPGLRGDGIGGDRSELSGADLGSVRGLRWPALPTRGPRSDLGGSIDRRCAGAER